MEKEMAASIYELPKLLLEITKAVGAVVVFLIALSQYIEAQRWKRHEYLSNQVQKFKDDPDVQLSLKMLDWYERKLTLPDKSTYTIEPKRFRKIICDEETSDREDIKFSSAEAELRDAFSTFLSWIDKFGADLEAGLIDQSTLDLYLGYWLERLSFPAESRLPEQDSTEPAKQSNEGTSKQPAQVEPVVTSQPAKKSSLKLLLRCWLERLVCQKCSRFLPPAQTADYKPPIALVPLRKAKLAVTPKPASKGSKPSRSSELATFYCILRFIDDYQYTKVKELLTLLGYEAKKEEKEEAVKAFEELSNNEDELWEKSAISSEVAPKLTASV